MDTAALVQRVAPGAVKALAQLAEPIVPAFLVAMPPEGMRIEHGDMAARAGGRDTILPLRRFEGARRNSDIIDIANHGRRMVGPGESRQGFCSVYVLLYMEGEIES